MEAIAENRNSDPANDQAGTVLRIHGAGAGSRIRAREVIEQISIILASSLALVAVLFALGPLVGWNTVRLASGSMSPGLPTDSLLLAHSVPASSVHVGDIVMVQRPGVLPVTHRVVSVGASVHGGESRELVLKGDANPADDVRPYDVSRVGLVVFGLPWGGQAVTLVRSPWILGLVTLVATLAILWGAWPRRRARHAAAGAAA